MDKAAIDLHLQGILSKKRYFHSVCVAKEAQKLAIKWKSDPDKAYLAGLAHDCCKDMTVDEQRNLASKCRFRASSLELSVPALLHGIAGAFYAENILEIKDEDILAAIRYHSEARAGMCRLEEIVYMADLVAADRNYRDVERLRKLAYLNLNLAMLEALRFYVTDVVSKYSKLPFDPVEAYNQYTLAAERETLRTPT